MNPVGGKNRKLGARGRPDLLTTTQWEAVPALYFKVSDAAQTAARGEIRRRLRADAEAKVSQRTGAGLADYRIRPDSYQEREIDGRDAGLRGELTPAVAKTLKLPQ